MSNVIENGNYCVYVHTSPSGKMYVGQTGKPPEQRWGKNGSHYLNKKNGKYNHPAFANAILKYGWNNFEHEIIARKLTKEEADNFEKLLIEKLNTLNPQYGYNCKEGGSNAGFSEETRKKMSEAHKGKKLTAETRKKIGEAHKGENSPMYGKHLNEETRKKISAKLKGNVISEKIRKKISNSLKGKRMGAERIGAKMVVQYDMQGNLIKIWDSIADAERALGINSANIAKCCKDANDSWKTIGGYIWRYFGDELTKEHIDRCNQRKNSSRIAQYSPLGTLIHVFENMTEAELATGINHSNISACCHKRREKAGGFIWKYYEDIEEMA